MQTPVWFTAFSAADIRAMELTILTALEWRSMCATPVDFLDCLLCLANIGRDDEGVLADGGRPATTIRRIAQELIIQTLKGARLQAKTPPLSPVLLTSGQPCCQGCTLTIVWPLQREHRACARAAVDQDPELDGLHIAHSSLFHDTQSRSPSP